MLGTGGQYSEGYEWTVCHDHDYSFFGRYLSGRQPCGDQFLIDGVGPAAMPTDTTFFSDIAASDSSSMPVSSAFSSADIFTSVAQTNAVSTSTGPISSSRPSAGTTIQTAATSDVLPTPKEPATSHHPSTAVAVGSTDGAVDVAASVGLLLLYLHGRKSSSTTKQVASGDPAQEEKQDSTLNQKSANEGRSVSPSAVLAGISPSSH